MDVPSKILIVKASALGDIIQAFPVLDALRAAFPQATIDWVVDRSLEPLVSSHPLVHQTLPISLKGLSTHRKWRSFLADLRTFRNFSYDLVFDLQGNIKSALVVASVRSPLKVGFGWRSVRERISLFATNRRFNVPRDQNIRLQYISLIHAFLKMEPPSSFSPLRFPIPPPQFAHLQSLLAHPALESPLRVMICPGSKWTNKRLPLETLAEVLHRMHQEFAASFLLVWGDAAEKAECEALQSLFPNHSLLVDKLPLPTWQTLMSQIDLVIAVDSAALHLCGTTSTPSFSLFGPTNPAVFKPLGPHHFALQGPCPYGRSFEKQCPVLRTCPTGACLRNLSSETIFQAFSAWWLSLKEE
ncbi:MAG: glycosyltransferase family 9 protein [Verrucomicrobiota bacterium]|nr:glycosyltransferase family 9 protein [Verrucomicrobiota bacterium]